MFTRGHITPLEQQQRVCELNAWRDYPFNQASYVYNSTALQLAEKRLSYHFKQCGEHASRKPGSTCTSYCNKHKRRDATAALPLLHTTTMEAVAVKYLRQITAQLCSSPAPVM